MTKERVASVHAQGEVNRKTKEQKRKLYSSGLSEPNIYFCPSQSSPGGNSSGILWGFIDAQEPGCSGQHESCLPSSRWSCQWSLASRKEEAKGSFQKLPCKQFAYSSLARLSQLSTCGDPIPRSLYCCWPCDQAKHPIVMEGVSARENMEISGCVGMCTR